MSGWVGLLARVVAVLAVGALVIAIVVGVLNEMGEDIDTDQGADLSLITNQTTCELAGGTWTAANTPPCA